MSMSMSTGLAAIIFFICVGGHSIFAQAPEDHKSPANTQSGGDKKAVPAASGPPAPTNGRSENKDLLDDSHVLKESEKLTPTFKLTFPSAPDIFSNGERTKRVYEGGIVGSTDREKDLKENPKLAKLASCVPKIGVGQDIPKRVVVTVAVEDVTPPKDGAGGEVQLVMMTDGEPYQVFLMTCLDWGHLATPPDRNFTVGILKAIMKDRVSNIVRMSGK